MSRQEISWRMAPSSCNLYDALLNQFKTSNVEPVIMSEDLEQQVDFKTGEDLKALKDLWVVEQDALLERLITEDTKEWQRVRNLRLVGGMDLSFSKHDQSLAVCTLVICDVKQNMKVVYEDSIAVRLTVPYIPGFLAFREVKPCQHLYKKLIKSHPDLLPQVVLFDGNGILHPRGLGLASHFGILEDVCTVGVAKNLFQMGSLLRDDQHKTQISKLKGVGDFFHLYHDDQRILGVALKTSEHARRPIYVSIGHQINLDSAIWIVLECVTDFRIPEPTRQADIRSRNEIAKCAFKEILEFD